MSRPKNASHQKEDLQGLIAALSEDDAISALALVIRQTGSGAPRLTLFTPLNVRLSLEQKKQLDAHLRGMLGVLKQVYM